ncbi:glycosyltransferase family 2 protein [Desulfatirhabdium butyrativorans]|uniref:glycosyltransferase family 2 protein n=1 Tax=Desulfatirhabdium butyrativorans TaxID=340467 RepID=UPI0004145F35|nr:glycosyltransferase family 2 protein [Desulfatirhabdium butyrativorans]
MDVSVVLPVYNEEENIPILYRELCEALAPTKWAYEIIFVDDGSSDRSWEILSGIQYQDDRVVAIRFRRNFGQTAALSAGFDHASGDVVVTLDADLQNDPKDIPLLVAKLQEGYDLVNGWRYERKDPFLSRKLPSRIANWIISTTTHVKLHDYGCTLKVFRKEIAANLRLYGEMHRFIPAIASGLGAAITEVRVNHRERKFGKSKYGISRTIRVVLDLITVKFFLSYSTRPIQIFGLLGVVSGGLGFLMALWMTIQRQFYGMSLANRPLLLLAILLMFTGLQFVSLGLIAELQSRTYHESQNKPIYVIRKTLQTENHQRQ